MPCRYIVMRNTTDRYPRLRKNAAIMEYLRILLRSAEKSMMGRSVRRSKSTKSTMKRAPRHIVTMFRSAVPSVAKSTPLKDMKVSAAPSRTIPVISSRAFTRGLSVRYRTPSTVAAIPMGMLMKKMYSQPT